MPASTSQIKVPGRDIPKSSILKLPHMHWAQRGRQESHFQHLPVPLRDVWVDFAHLRPAAEAPSSRPALLQSACTGSQAC